MYAIVNTTKNEVIRLTHELTVALEAFEDQAEEIAVLDGTSGEWHEFSTSDTGPGPLIENQDLLAIL